MTKTPKTLLFLVWRMNVILILRLRPVTVKVPTPVFAFIQVTSSGTSCSLYTWICCYIHLPPPHLKCHPVFTGWLKDQVRKFYYGVQDKCQLHWGVAECSRNQGAVMAWQQWRRITPVTAKKKGVGNRAELCLLCLDLKVVVSLDIFVSLELESLHFSQLESSDGVIFGRKSGTIQFSSHTLWKMH